MVFTMNSTNNSYRTTAACTDFIDFFQNNYNNEFQDSSTTLTNVGQECEEDNLMDASFASFDHLDTATFATLENNMATTTRQEIPLIQNKIDLMLESLEPKPLSGDIQRVAQLPLAACLSDDLLKNCNEYCMALQSLSIKQPGKLTRTNSNPNMYFASLSCPKPAVPRSYSDSSSVSVGSTGSGSSSDVVHIYDYQQERWMERYQQLSAFFRENGHSDVSNEFEANLAGWVRRQRHQFKRAKQGRRSTLTGSRVKLLEQVGFKWDFHDLAWNENFERLKMFYQIHKHCNVPTSSSCSTFFGSKEENDRLLNWCKRQKRAIRMYLKNSDAVGSRMNAKRFELLQSIGFRWQPVKKNEGTAAT
jgi:Helicase associated domain